MLTPAQKLIDEIRELQAKAEGKKIELCMMLGDRDGAQAAQREMFALIEARAAAARLCMPRSLSAQNQGAGQTLPGRLAA